MSPAVDIASVRALLPPTEWPRFDYAMELYTGDVELEDPRVSSTNGDLTGLPPLYVQWSESEPAAAGISRFVDRARQAGTSVTRDTWPDLPHGWQLFAAGAPEANEAMRSIDTFIRQLE